MSLWHPNPDFHSSSPIPTQPYHKIHNLAFSSISLVLLFYYNCEPADAEEASSREEDGASIITKYTHTHKDGLLRLISNCWEDSGKQHCVGARSLSLLDSKAVISRSPFDPGVPLNTQKKSLRPLIENNTTVGHGDDNVLIVKRRPTTQGQEEYSALLTARALELFHQFFFFFPLISNVIKVEQRLLCIHLHQAAPFWKTLTRKVGVPEQGRRVFLCSHYKSKRCHKHP